MLVVYLSLFKLAASGVGTLVGFGISTIMIPALLLFQPMAQTLVFVGIIHWFGDIWKLVLFREGIRWEFLLTFGIPGIVLSYAGATLSLSVDEQVLSRIVGAFILVYVAYILANPDFQLPQRRTVAMTGGGLSGFFAGIFGLGGAIRATFLTAFDLPKAVYLATTGAIALAIDSTRLVTYVSGGTRLGSDLWWALVACVPVSLLGAKLAERVVKYIPEKKFRIVIAVMLAAMAVKLLIFP